MISCTSDTVGKAAELLNMARGSGLWDRTVFKSMGVMANSSRVSRRLQMNVRDVEFVEVDGV